jgi:hypothetical protein
LFSFKEHINTNLNKNQLRQKHIPSLLQLIAFPPRNKSTDQNKKIKFHTRWVKPTIARKFKGSIEFSEQLKCKIKKETFDAAFSATIFKLNFQI